LDKTGVEEGIRTETRLDGSRLGKPIGDKGVGNMVIVKKESRP
jgi:hypothetical protein